MTEDEKKTHIEPMAHVRLKTNQVAKLTWELKCPNI